jgi:plasmid maintenance system killer protein
MRLQYGLPVRRGIRQMIKTFAHSGLEDFFYAGTKKGIQPKHAQKIGDILDLLDAAVRVEDMNFPGSGLHQIKGDRKRAVGGESLRELAHYFQVFCWTCL